MTTSKTTTETAVRTTSEETVAVRNKGPDLPGVREIQEEFPVPDIAFPTLTLMVVGVVLLAYAVLGVENTPVATGVAAVAIYLLFTPMHDAAHRAIATVKSGYGWLNVLVLTICSSAFCSPGAAFRYVHLQHHRHTGDEHHDPDDWSCTGDSLLHLMAKWSTQEFYYYRVYLPLVFTGRRPVRESVFALTHWTLILGGLAYLCMTGHGAAVWYRLVLPGRIASCALAFAFDYLPHRMHVTREEDPMRATHPVSIHKEWIPSIWTWVLLQQSYHNIHHSFPMLPFYFYTRVWRKLSSAYRSAGTPIVPLFPLVATPSRRREKQP